MWESMGFFQELVANRCGTERTFEVMVGTSASNRFSSSEEIARTILHLASDESAHLTGLELVISQGHAG
jgi:NAD(P)-dependent dehydrogenase (short-subunit alcohol dehydrogenase family)